MERGNGGLMRILLTNDDGIGAPGLQALRRALLEIDGIELSVVAPDRTVVEDLVQSLVAPGVEGYLGVQAGHEPTIVARAVAQGASCGSPRAVLRQIRTRLVASGETAGTPDRGPDPWEHTRRPG